MRIESVAWRAGCTMLDKKVVVVAMAVAAVILATFSGLVTMLLMSNKARVYSNLELILEVDGEFDRILMHGADVSGDMSLWIWRNASGFRRYSYHQKEKKNFKRGIIALDRDPTSLKQALVKTKPYVASISEYDKDSPVYELGDLDVLSPSFLGAHPPNSVDKVVYAYVLADAAVRGRSDSEVAADASVVCSAWRVINKSRAWAVATADRQGGGGEEPEPEPEKCPVSGLAYPPKRRARNLFALIEATQPLSPDSLKHTVINSLARSFPTISAIVARVEGATCDGELSLPGGGGGGTTVRVTGGWRNAKIEYSMSGTVFVFEPFVVYSNE